MESAKQRQRETADLVECLAESDEDTKAGQESKGRKRTAASSRREKQVRPKALQSSSSSSSGQEIQQLKKGVLEYLQAN